MPYQPTVNAAPQETRPDELVMDAARVSASDQADAEARRDLIEFIPLAEGRGYQRCPICSYEFLSPS
jgi:hypothetical protein